MRYHLETGVRPGSLRALPTLKTRGRDVQTKIYFPSSLRSVLRAPRWALPSDMKALDLPRFNYVLAVIKLPFCRARAISQPSAPKKRLVIIIIVPRAARTRAELRNELVNHGDINAVIKIKRRYLLGFEGALSHNFTAQMWARGAETLRVKLPLKLLFPLNTLIFHRLLLWRGLGSCNLPQNAKSTLEMRYSRGARGWRGRKDRESYSFYYFQMFPREHHGAFTSTRLDSLQNNGADSTPGFKGLIAPDSAWPGRSGAGQETRFNPLHMHSSCSSECFIASRVQSQRNPQKTNSLGSLRLCPLPQTHRGSP